MTFEMICFSRIADDFDVSRISNIAEMGIVDASCTALGPMSALEIRVRGSARAAYRMT